MPDIFISASMLAICSGLGAVAFKRPRIFLGFLWPLYLISFWVLSSAITWNTDVNFASSHLLNFVKDVSLHDATASISQDQAPWWAISTGIAFMLYIFFLQYLAEQIKHEEIENKRNTCNLGEVD